MMDYFIDWSLWALTVAPFVIGGFGGGSSPQPPQLNVNQSAQLFEKQLQLQQQYLPSMVATAGTASRGQDAEAARFGLGMLTDPASAIYRQPIEDSTKAIEDARKQLSDLDSWRSAAARPAVERGGRTVRAATQGRRYDPKARKWINDDEFASRQQEIRNRIAAEEANINRLRASDPVGDLRRALPEEFAARDRLLGQIRAAQESSPEYQRAQAAMAAGLGRGELGESLYQTALQRANSQGQLTPEANRDAVQAARAGMAARGMATGSAGLGAELLNRDRYSRARMAEDLAFAGGVQANEQARQTYNIGLLGQASQMSDAERARQLGLGQDAYNFGLSTNPRMMLAGLGSPYANMTAPAMQMVSNARGLEPMYSGGQFSGGGFNTGGAAMGALGGAASGAAIGAAFGGWGAIPGALIGGAMGAFGGGMSDKREKTDIKKIDGPTNVIGIPAYEYRYKGEKKKRLGVMAQDVQKVLPEAVAEIDYKGKKRLAIKPAVIGAALAEQLAADTKPVALAS